MLLKLLFRKAKIFLFENRDTRQTIAKNVFWLTVGNLGSRLMRAAIIIYAARILGAEEYGIFSYVMGLAGFFTVFTDLGVGQVMTRESAKNPQERSYYFATGFWMKSVLLVIIAAFIILVMPYLSNIKGIEFFLPWVAALIIFDGIREFAQSFFRALEKMEWEALVTLITNILITTSGFIILNSYAEARSFTAVYALSVGMGAASALFLIKDEFKKIWSHYKNYLTGRIMKAAVPIALSSALGAFMLNTDLVMLGWWVKSADIGYYSAGQKIVQLFYTLPAILASAIFPTLARLIGQRENEKIRKLTEKSLGAVFLIAFPLVVGGIILGRPLIEFIYGEDYLPAVLNFQILLITLLIAFPGVLLGNSAIAYEKQKDLTKYLLAAAISNIVFNAIFIPRLGIIGSSISTIIALLLDVALTWRLLKKINNFYILPLLKKIIISSLAMAIFTFALDFAGVKVMPNIILSALIYFGLLYLLREQIILEFKPLLKKLRI